ncbi:hypothetical protein [Flavobacterium salmonis]|uniref:Oligosaccharide repeat unit polymerase n=1 Tax=Flavobacterium salmonis TaxID=2654844 RepID=A0A6V6YZF8_9FLAO|nr:hypothetical protein [Flavobacterium salmonis]CAD0004614.1 hypothetical protein FLAT13_02376 [Flavobacterium salmonis]
MKRKQNVKFFIVIILIIWLLAFYGVSILSSIGLLIVIYIGNKFLNELGKTIPILELILFVSGFQWIIGPFILYRIEPDFMQVSENEYMAITVGAYLSFVTGCLFIRSKKAILDKTKIREIISRPKTISIIKSIYWVGLVFFVVSFFFKTSLDFIFTIIYSFSFITAIMLLYSPIPNKKIYVIAIYSLLFLKCIYQSVFAEFISQCFLLIIFIPNIYSLSKKKIIILLGLGILMLSVINTAKTAYRSKVWSDRGREVNISLFFTILFNSEKSENDTDNSFLQRISSGSVNSSIFSYVPKYKQHTQGEVLLEDFANAIIPRILYADKKDIDNSKNYMLYTGRYLGEGTSVGVNALGIGYAEFGVIGCFIFMGIYGLSLNSVLNFCITKSKKNILYLFSIIVVFIGAIKAETEFIGLINGLLKAFFFVIIFIYFISKNKTRLFSYGS